MNRFTGKKTIVIGLDASGTAACKLLAGVGATVLGVPANDATLSQKETLELRKAGVVLGNEKDITAGFEVAVHSANISRSNEVVQACLNHGIEVISELELGSQHLYCLSIAVTGTNGKTTTAELIDGMITHSQRVTARAGASGEPVCSISERSRELDFAVLDTNSFQLESLAHFRPAVAVLLNLKPDHLDQYDRVSTYVQTLGRIFKNQQVFDWAIIQAEALAYLRELNIPIPAKVITFSATTKRADIYLDRGLLISSLPNWNGPLFNMEQCVLRGPHHAENVMAALAVGHVLRLRLEDMISSVKRYQPGPHRLEKIAEIDGVKFINNSKAMNADAVAQSIEALPSAPAGEPNIWLIAGGKDKGLDYHDLGPILSRRVKGVFLIGETREKLRAAWSLFTPCVVAGSLLEAVSNAAEAAIEGDFVLLSPGCSSLDTFRSYQHRGEIFRNAVEHLAEKKKTGPELAPC